MSDWATLSRAT